MAVESNGQESVTELVNKFFETTTADSREEIKRELIPFLAKYVHVKEKKDPVEGDDSQNFGTHQSKPVQESDQSNGNPDQSNLDTDQSDSCSENEFSGGSDFNESDESDSESPVQETDQSNGNPYQSDSCSDNEVFGAYDFKKICSKIPKHRHLAKDENDLQVIFAKTEPMSSVPENCLPALDKKVNGNNQTSPKDDFESQILQKWDKYRLLAEEKSGQHSDKVCLIYEDIKRELQVEYFCSWTRAFTMAYEHKDQICGPWKTVYVDDCMREKLPEDEFRSIPEKNTAINPTSDETPCIDATITVPGSANPVISRPFFIDSGASTGSIPFSGLKDFEDAIFTRTIVNGSPTVMVVAKLAIGEIEIPLSCFDVDMETPDWYALGMRQLKKFFVVFPWGNGKALLYRKDRYEMHGDPDVGVTISIKK